MSWDVLGQWRLSTCRGVIMLIWWPVLLARCLGDGSKCFHRETAQI